MTKWEPSDARLGCHPKAINLMHHMSGIKDKSHTIIAIDAEKASDTVQHPFTIKSLRKLEVTYSAVKG